MVVARGRSPSHSRPAHSHSHSHSGCLQEAAFGQRPAMDRSHQTARRLVDAHLGLCKERSSRCHVLCTQYLQDLLREYETPGREGPTNAANPVARNADEAGLRVAALLGLQRCSVFGRGSPARTKADPGNMDSIERVFCCPRLQSVRSTCRKRYFVAQGPSWPCFAAKNFSHVCNPQIALECTQPSSAIPHHDRFSGSASRSGRSRQLGPNQMETLPGTT